jgi:leader peptidase (prepilin peptidase)/N-methyltransferase
MEALWAIFFALLGLVIGSFLNVCIDRIPRRQSLTSPPSHCPECDHKLSTLDLIPIFSYLWLKGRCRYCKTPIPRRVLYVEMATGATFAILYLFYGLSGDLAVTLVYFSLFLALFFIDVEHHLLPNKLVYPGAALAVVLSLFLSRLEVVPGIGSAAAGGGIGLGIFLLIALLSRGGMGWGDVKMAGFIGLAVGFPLVFVAILLAVVAGGLVAGILMATQKKGRKQAIAFGPFLALGAMATILWGQTILDWYLGFFS